MVRRRLAAAVLAAGLSLAGANSAAAAAPLTTTASAASGDTATTTTLPVDQGDRSVIPAPNTGRAPQDAGDRGGWAQLLLFGIMAVGSMIIFGRVLWAGHQRSRANRTD